MALSTERMEELVSTLSDLTILEVSGLVKQLEEKWGVSAAVPVVVAGGGAGRPHQADHVTPVDSGPHRHP